MISWLSDAKGRHGSGKGDEDRDTCAAVSLFRAARNRDLSSAPFDQLPGDPKPDARSQIAPRREEWLEDLFQMLRFDPRPSVSNHSLNSITCGADKLSGGDL